MTAPLCDGALLYGRRATEKHKAEFQKFIDFSTSVGTLPEYLDGRDKPTAVGFMESIVRDSA
jgi:hypothetical protein